jgi:hypothetical protein
MLNARLLVHEKRKQDYKGWTEEYLMVWEELAGSPFDNAAGPGYAVVARVVDRFICERYQGDRARSCGASSKDHDCRRPEASMMLLVFTIPTISFK